MSGVSASDSKSKSYDAGLKATSTIMPRQAHVHAIRRKKFLAPGAKVQNLVDLLAVLQASFPAQALRFSRQFSDAVFSHGYSWGCQVLQFAFI